MGGAGLYVWGSYGAALLLMPSSRCWRHAGGGAADKRPWLNASTRGRPMKPRHKKLALAGGVLVAVGAIVALVLNAFQSNLVFFYSPTQVAKHEAPQRSHLPRRRAGRRRQRQADGTCR
jgi:hypothetical protein